MRELRNAGYTVAVVERWLPYANQRQDLFGMFDLLAIKSGSRPLLVQVTSTGLSVRRKKILANELLPIVQEFADCELHGWRKSAKGRYVQRVESLSAQ